MAAPRLAEQLDAWVSAGLIDADQAASIAAHEAHTPTDSLPRWVEPLSYVGAALVVVAISVLGIEVWGRIDAWGRVAITGGAALILLVAGATLVRSESAPARRGGQVAWLAALAPVAGVAAIVIDEYTRVRVGSQAFYTALAALAVALPLWLVTRSALQHVGLAAAAGAAVVSASFLSAAYPHWLPALLIASLGVVWLLLTWGGLLSPAGVGWVAGSLMAAGVGFGGGDGAGWQLAGVAVGLGLVWLSTRVEQRSVLALGVVALLVWIPAAVTSLFEGTVAVPIAILATGVIILTVVVVAVRAGRRDRTPDA